MDTTGRTQPLDRVFLDWLIRSTTYQSCRTTRFPTRSVFCAPLSYFIVTQVKNPSATNCSPRRVITACWTVGSPEYNIFMLKKK